MKGFHASRVSDIKTEQRLTEYNLLKALLTEWEEAPTEMQVENHDYLLKLRAKVRNHKAYLDHRNDPKARV